MGQQAAQIYQARIDQYEADIGSLKKRLNGYSMLRLVSFALAIFLLVKLFSENAYLAIGTSLAAFSLLLFFVNRSSRTAIHQSG